MRAIPCAILACVLTIGCLPPRSNESQKKSNDGANPVASATKQAAESSGREYLRRLAAVCRQQAERSSDFKSWAELFDFGHSGEADARKAFEAFEEAMTARLNPADHPYDADAVRQAFIEAAEGLERAAQ